MTISPQSQALYQILLGSAKPLSAKDLASKLNIYPSILYRLTKPLIDMGLITKTIKYPIQFRAKPLGDGLSLFLLYQNEWFSKNFNLSGKKGSGIIPKSDEIGLSFIQSRDELMNQSAVEISKATTSVDILRSGHEIPADVILAITEAKKRNVTTRMLIQDYTRENAEQVRYWQKNGILVRKSSQRHIRLLTFDNSVIYFMSYKNTDSSKDLGVKISYPPFAIILSQLFQQWWEEAEII